MFSFFTGFLKTGNVINEFVVSSYLILLKFVKKYPFLNQSITFDFAESVKNLEHIEDLFSRIENQELKKMFLIELKSLKNWQDLYVKLFPYSLSSGIIDESCPGAGSKVENLTKIINNYRDERTIYLGSKKSDSGHGLPVCLLRKVLISLIHLLDITYRDINNKKDVSLNRKFNKQIQAYLFTEKQLENYIMTQNEETIVRLINLIDDIKELDKSTVIELKHKVMNQIPSVRFMKEAEKETVSRGLIVTRRSYEAKQKQLQHIRSEYVIQ